jgi:hypothetical protein
VLETEHPDESNARSNGMTASPAQIGTHPAPAAGMLQSARSSAPRARLALVVLFVGVGCGSPPPIDKQLDTLSSWTATLQLAKELHGDGAITATYATQLRDRANEELESTSTTIGRSARTRVDSAYAVGALDSLRNAIRQLEAEIGS